ncbi:MAG: chromosome segregation protein SMC [Corynebacterium sp.]|nr:chromosome segregation protein SMC [Corynebacterium sp.]
MYLKSLTLRGFKSFASATTLKFEPGICVVVGPNGSGKSNVVDALAWVMGEQGAKTLRGGKMEDVIFAGAGDRKPLGRAEVTLTIDNSDGALNIDYTEVSVTRRMFRDGASEYEINGTKARLMDIQELLSDSGIGREMHVIVGQGRLSQILESRPEERRAFIEEAAGVLKHRRRKEKAQRKLVSMQANLDRLTDLTGELSRQLKPLARQAEAARRAATVQADLRDARLKLAGHELVQLQEKLGSAAEHAAMLAGQVEEATEQLETVTETQAALEEELATVAPAAETAQQLWFNLSSLVERISATKRIADDRVGSFQETAYAGQDPEQLERRAQQAATEYEELATQVDIAAERLENLRDEVVARQEEADRADEEHLAQVRAIADRREGIVRLLAQQESQRAQVTAMESEITRHEESVAETLERVQDAEAQHQENTEKLAALTLDIAPLREAHAQAVAAAEATENRLEQVRSQRQELERHVSRLESRIETLRATAPATGELGDSLAGEYTPLAEHISIAVTAPSGTDSALALALGSLSEALASTAMLDDATRAALNNLPESTPRTAVVLPAGGTTWHLEAKLPPDATWLLDHISIAPPYVEGVSRALADVVLVPDLDAAWAVVEADPRLKAVTPSGILVGHGWFIAGRGARSMVEITTQITAAQEELATAQAELAQLAGTFAGAKQAAEDSRVQAAGATSALQEQEARSAELTRELKRWESQIAVNRKEYERTTNHAMQAETRLAELKQQLEETTDRLARVEDDTDIKEPTTQARDAAAQALSQIRSMEMEARLSLRTAEERAEAAHGKSANLLRQAEHERQAKARHEQAMVRRRRQAALAQVVANSARDLLARTTDATERATAERDRKIEHRNQLQTRLATVKDQVNALRTQLNRLTDNAHNMEITRSQAQVRMEEAQAKLVAQLGMPISDLIRDYTPGPDFDLKAETARLKQAEKDLSSLGKVNPLALEEYKALEERYEFLSTQLDDVEQARKDLTDVIEDVDAKILQLFTDAWLDVQAEFPKVFTTLFPGGDGRLILTEPESMLSTGIEVEARPPGKKVKRLSLLSGGEKSLTALAMLVAIFRARPSPFYVMDEVEAALDDVNLRRLIALFTELRKDSQLIVITHQKPTMDIANVLYGVTMRGDGITRVISQRMNPSEETTTQN